MFQFLNDCSAAAGLLVKDDRLEPEPFEEASYGLACSLIVPVDNERAFRRRRGALDLP
jgi:hypothetical protein